MSALNPRNQGRPSAPRARARRTAGLRARRRRRRHISRGGAQATAQLSLRKFSQATFFAVAITAFLVLLLGLGEGVGQDLPANDVQEQPAEDGERALGAEDLAAEASQQARETFARLWVGFVATLPQVLVALMVLLLAWLIVRLVRPVVRRVTGSLAKGPAITAVFGIVVWMLAIGIAVSAIAGDIRALVGSIGLVGLALSWALQTPIESFTGWLMNSFKGYYRVGDRIAVGEVFGDVVSIDFLTTTVWEYGGAERAPSGIRAEQPTGRLITFPNNEVLAGSIVNFTRDFPYVWDELPVPVAVESDLQYARTVIDEIAQDLLGDAMEEPANQYQRILERANLPPLSSTRPEVYVALTESGADLTVRYLVPARQRRIWRSRLTLRVLTEFQQPEHNGRIIQLYQRHQVQFLDGEGLPTTLPGEGD